MSKQKPLLPRVLGIAFQGFYALVGAVAATISIRLFQREEFLLATLALVVVIVALRLLYRSGRRWRAITEKYGRNRQR